MTRSLFCLLLPLVLSLSLPASLLESAAETPIPSRIPSSYRHPVSIVNADIYVKKFKTVARLTFFAEDLELLQGVEPMEDGFYDSEELVDATTDHVDYLMEKVQLINAAGQQLQGKLVQRVDIQFPVDEDGEPARIRSGDLMNYEIQLTFEYDYQTPLEFLTINQQMVADGALLPSELKVLLKQAGSDEPFARILKPNQPETVRFDWEKPILPSDASDEDWQKWAEEQRQKTLGIESYSSTYSFIYITRDEIRHEVLIPVATLATLIDLEREKESFLSIAEQDEAKEKIQSLFRNANRVKINGIEVAPIFDRIDFYGLDLRDFAMQAERRRISMANGRVGLILSYRTKGLPQEVEVEWDLFNEVIRKVESVIFPFNNVEKFSYSKFAMKFNTETGEVDNSANVYQWVAQNLESLPPIENVPDQFVEQLRQSRKLNIRFSFFIWGVAWSDSQLPVFIVRGSLCGRPLASRSWGWPLILIRSWPSKSTIRFRHPIL